MMTQTFGCRMRIFVSIVIVNELLIKRTTYVFILLARCRNNAFEQFIGL